MNQIALSQALGRLMRWKNVPAVRHVFLPQLLHLIALPPFCSCTFVFGQQERLLMPKASILLYNSSKQSLSLGNSSLNSDQQARIASSVAGTLFSNVN